MRNPNYSMWIEINNKPVREYFHDGQYFIEGREGSAFTIKLQNNTRTKIKAVISVDGLSIIDGNPAGEQSQSYVVSPLSTETFNGWRTSETTVQEFFFSSKRKSYAYQINADTSNVGVIGAMVFSEEVPNYYVGQSSQSPVWTNPFPISTYPVTTPRGIGGGTTSSASNYFSLNTQTSNIGTGFGNEIKSHTYNDYSMFKNHPDDILCIYYDNKQGLEKRGVIIDPSKSYPNAFPIYTKANKFARRPIK